MLSRLNHRARGYTRHLHTSSLVRRSGENYRFRVALHRRVLPESRSQLTYPENNGAEGVLEIRPRAVRTEAREAGGEFNRRRARFADMFL